MVGDWILWSTRPLPGGDWDASHERPPPAAYVNLDGSPETPIGPVTGESRGQSHPPKEGIDGKINRAEVAVGGSQDHPPIETLEEVAGSHLFARYPLGDMPVSRLPTPIPPPGGWRGARRPNFVAKKGPRRTKRGGRAAWRPRQLRPRENAALGKVTLGAVLNNRLLGAI